MFSQSDILQTLPKQFFASLVAKVNAKVAQGYDVINLGQGNPDQPTYDYIVDALIESAKNPASHKYSQFRGNANFKEATSQFYKDNYQVDLDSEKEICVLGGAKIGLVEFPVAAMNPGDLLCCLTLVIQIIYQAFLGKIEFETFPLKAENEFCLICQRFLKMWRSAQNSSISITLTILPELWQRRHFMKNWLLGRKIRCWCGQ